MPLLSDAKSCLVGQTQIKKIYAGTQLVWPKAPASRLRIVNLFVPGGIGNGNNLCAEFVEQEECANCAEMKTTYQFRYYANNGWTAWNSFTGYRTNTDGIKAYQYITQTGDQRLQDALFELRTNGIVEQIKIDLPTAPNLGTIVVELYCSA